MRMVLAAVMVVGAYTSAWAWGEEGHSIIGDVAQHRVNATTQVGISSLLGQGRSLAAVASWANDERARDKTTTNWHFVDIPSATTTYDASRDCKADAVLQHAPAHSSR
ncbi:S1/P1 nuclease [Neorhizobium galegae]|uniref:S1/P1 nuclease n=1 Tax=Neorhizobium galegae TaxID=399 RepID=UPI001282971A|nr:hypothetical protein F4V88_27765 [Neorhizobium galegae]